MNTNSPFSVLFVCTGNMCRSIMAEALLSHHGSDRVRACSAGSHPAGVVHPLALKVLAELGIDAGDARSKSWNEFAGQPFNTILTLCDSAAGETCPWFPDSVLRAHWGTRDPFTFIGNEEETLACFREVRDHLEARVKAMLALPLETPERLDLQKELSEIGLR
ncbi:MAG: arsenate reductase ArsC [Gammaproteobacteria bacterium]|nr:arsenate reductase ArsC [Gammaproteobacteria bacterium]